MRNETETLWKLLWDYDPNGLLVVDKEMNVTTVNPACCEMFGMDEQVLLKLNAEDLLDDIEELKSAWKTGEVIKSKEREYPQHNLYVRKVIFPMKDKGLVGCILVDLSHERAQLDEIRRIKQESIEQINGVVNKQMKVAQEIAGLLGESTAETKVSLLKLREMLEQEASLL
jgi:PAS domain S-box-containing protein